MHYCFDKVLLSYDRDSKEVVHTQDAQLRITISTFNDKSKVTSSFKNRANQFKKECCDFIENKLIELQNMKQLHFDNIYRNKIVNLLFTALWSRFENQDKYSKISALLAELGIQENNFLPLLHATKSYNERLVCTKLGFNKGEWMHTKVPIHCPHHLKFNKKLFDIQHGIYDKATGKHIFPGEDIYCYCYYKLCID
ncbi:MAG: hypothetical protein QG673_523 [Pseudomonadota bacterium]|nr:hypothetical protein [Pseudomonadota bacterium]